MINLIHGLAVLASAFGPDEDRSWLWRAATKLRHAQGRGELTAAPSLTASEVFRWCLRQMVEVDGDPDPSDVKPAIDFRDAIMIGILISCPVRRRAFLAITVKGHLNAMEDGFLLRFSAEDMKDRKARKFPLACQLIEPMQLYLDLYRPILLGNKQTECLWLSWRGKPLAPHSCSKSLAIVTEKHFGVTLRSHAFRHIAATSIAEIDPEHVGIIRDVLGHATLDMAEKHYNRASRQFQLQTVAIDRPRHPAESA